MSPEASPLLIREQWPAISGMTRGLLWSFVPARLKSRLRDEQAVLEQTIEPASRKLVDAYVAWTGAPAERYAETLPAHFFCHYGMNMVASLTSLAPCNMLKVVNQGCRLRYSEELPRDEPLRLRGQLVDCRQDGQRLRVHSRIEVGTARHPGLMSVDTLAAVMRGPSQSRRKPAAAETHWEELGEWSADRHDGQRFFFLTGDFNPIHTLWPVARLSRFGGCILHGFGTLARSFEVIRDAGHAIGDFDARFVKPNLLPSGPNTVAVGRTADAEGYRPLRLTTPAGDVLLGGRFAAGDKR